MTPAQLTASSFAAYRAKAQKIAVASLPLLQQLPLAFVPFLLKEIQDADVKFPVEVKELEDQLAYLKAMTAEQRTQQMQPFAGLLLNGALASSDWVNSPAQFLEQLSAHLWATHQMDGFRRASETYVRQFHASLTPAALPSARATVVLAGQGMAALPSRPVFVKLAREGTLFTRVQPGNGIDAVQKALEERAARYPAPYSHWYVDGATAAPLKGFASVGYGQLAAVRDALAAKMLAAYEARPFDPEMLRTSLARTTFESLGLQPTGDAALDHFSLTLLTEGSGTQIYSTTFVQWAAREAMRRAQPLTLFARYAARQREKPMNELLSGSKSSSRQETDPAGSLIDAEMGAYYTWLNQQRLAGAEQSRFLVWFENESVAVVISPDHKRAVTDSSAIKLSNLLGTVLLS
jgi:hypothetical protein